MAQKKKNSSYGIPGTVMKRVKEVVHENGNRIERPLLVELLVNEGFQSVSAYRSIKKLIEKNALQFDRAYNEVYDEVEEQKEDRELKKLLRERQQKEDRETKLTSGEEVVFDYLVAKRGGDITRWIEKVESISGTTKMQFGENVHKIIGLQDMDKNVRIGLFANMMIDRKKYNLSDHDMEKVIHTLHLDTNDGNKIENLIYIFQDLKQGKCTEETIDFFSDSMGGEKLKELLNLIGEMSEITEEFKQFFNTVDKYYDDQVYKTDEKVVKKEA